jgi:hypothetical protein
MEQRGIPAEFAIVACIMLGFRSAPTRSYPAYGPGKFFTPPFFAPLTVMRFMAVQLIPLNTLIG